MLDFSPYKLVPYDKARENELIGLLCKCYAEFENQELVELYGLDSDLLDIENIYAKPSCFMLLIDSNQANKLIGTIAVKVNKDEASLKRVFLDKDYRGQGLGKKLSQWGFDYAKEQGCKIMHIWSGTFCHAAHKLYKNLGAKDMQEKRAIGGIKNIEEFYFLKEL